MIKFYISFLFLILFYHSSAQNFTEYYLTFEIKEKKELNEITRIISIDKVTDKTVYAYATDKSLEKFKQLGYQYTLLKHPGKGIKEVLATTMEEMDNWDKYPTYDLYIEMMNYYASTYPGICKLVNLGSSVNGRDLLALKISDNVDSEEDEPEFFYTSTMHGDETTGYVLMLRLIDSLLTSYETEPEIANIINEIEIYINPISNPDGTYRNDNNTISSPTRSNANGADLNRNFPDPANGDHPDGNSWQPETQAMMNFAKNHRIVLSANFHGGIELANYPWDHTYRRHPDDAWFIKVSRDYATSAQNNSPSGYFTGQNNGITNGADWYVVYGSRQDYYTFYHNSREITFEISDTKFVSGSSLPNYWNYNKEALFLFMRECLYGIKGTVKNSDGDPLNAMIFIEGHDTDLDSSMVFTDPDVGDYHRMIEEGTYNIIASSNGYINDTIKDIYISENSIVTVNFVLNENTIESSLNINEINDTLPEDTIKHYLIIITNTGEEVLNFSITEDDIDGYSWITLDKNNGQVSVNDKDTVSLEINSNDLEAGDYEANLIYSEQDGDEININIKINVQSTVSINSLQIVNSITSIYPNPFTDYIYINIENNITGKILVNIINIDGKKVYELHLINNDNSQIKLDNLSKLPKGNYILKIVSEDKIHSKQMLKME